MSSRPKGTKAIRIIRRCVAYLAPYARLTAGSYLVVLLTNAIQIYQPLIIRKVIDVGIRGHVPQTIITGAIQLLVLTAVGGLFTFLSGRWTEMASQGVAYDLRNAIHGKLQSLSFSYHDKAESGQLIGRAISDVDRVRFLTGRALLRLATTITLVLGIAVAMFFIDARLAVATLVIIPFMAVISVNFGTRLRPISREVQQKEAVLMTHLEQNLRGARTVKGFAQEEPEIERFRSKNRDLYDFQMMSARMSSIFSPLMNLLVSVGTLLVLVYGGALVIRHQLTLGGLVAFSTYVALLMAPIRQFGWIIGAVSQSAASGERIFEILDAQSEVAETPDAKPLGAVSGRVRFENVSFAHTRDFFVLKDISFDIAPGEIVALLGATGSGKTSIISLIPRFYDPTIGRVLIDETDARRVTIPSLRESIGIVMQDTILFSSTLRENIAFGRPGASMRDVEAAAQAARADEFIRSLPDGYDTRVGERGVTLSGGQRQRISIARALLKDPRIIILDDATSSVDTETESLIQEALSRLLEGRTSFIIAQRLSTIRKADVVIVLDHGRIAAIARGGKGASPHEELLRTSPIYADIFYGQLRPQEESHGAPPSNGHGDGGGRGATSADRRETSAGRRGGSL
jgi:ATP-binding cassette, subfamily B, multidrug efflux pump